MKLSDMMNVIDDNVDVEVIDRNGFTLAEYDGRNSIDEKYNDCTVSNIDVGFYRTERGNIYSHYFVIMLDIDNDIC